MPDLLSAVLARPDRLPAFSLAEWELVIGQARRARLIARLGLQCAERGWLDDIPERPRTHLMAVRRLCERQHREVHWEVDRIRRALAGVATPVVVLKGAAYLLAGLPPGAGRLFADIDIMVPRNRLDKAEMALFGHGWYAPKTNSYDQRYYRKWGHELPPLQHVQRNTVLDVHHTITPPTSRFRVDADKLFAAARPLDARGDLLVLAPVDMVLHSAAHLFQEGEFDHGLRDLLDVDDLLRHFGREPTFWSALVVRATELGLGRLLYYAVHHIHRLFISPLPAEFVTEVERFRPDELSGRAMSGLLRVALRPDHPSCDGPFTGLARWLLYVRAHHLRMPAHILVPHLIRKAYMRRFKDE
jgi:hypothetical protein